MTLLPGFTAPPVWEFAKHGGRLIAGERKYKNQLFFELRYWADDKATKKGVTLPVEAVADLARALTAYAASIAPSGPENDS